MFPLNVIFYETEFNSWKNTFFHGTPLLVNMYYFGILKYINIYNEFSGYHSGEQENSIFLIDYGLYLVLSLHLCLLTRWKMARGSLFFVQNVTNFHLISARKCLSLKSFQQITLPIATISRIKVCYPM